MTTEYLVNLLQNVDGLKLGVTIVLIGIILIGLYFRKRLKRAEAIIEEVYALRPPEESVPKE